ncbi:MAG: hypothetical protein KIT69_02680 [Propionibacteriaceae bacterium]|nr:hypothetical protein [Propionibacteriaceae bacterium]
MTRHLTGLLSASLALALALVPGTGGAQAAPSAVPREASPPAATTSVTDRFMAAQHDLLDSPDEKYWPGTRWWLAEGLHTDATIKKDMKQLHDMGIGHVEIVCMPEANVDANRDETVLVSNTSGKTPKQLYSWGSDEWKSDTELIITEATKYGMGFAMTSGTNWSNANLPIETLRPDDDGAGKSLGYAVQTTSAGTAFTGTLTRSQMTVTNPVVARQDLVAVVAMERTAGSTGSITASGGISGTINYTGEPVVLTSLVTLGGVPVTAATMKDPTGTNAYRLDWTPPAGGGTWDIYAFWMQGTGQSPSPSASQNITINYIDKAGMDAFIDYYRNEIFNDPELKSAIKQNGKGEIYMDSLEISASNGNTGEFWGATLMSEFQKRRGYSVEPYLPSLIKTGSGRAGYAFPAAAADTQKADRIRNDFYQTITEMYIDNVLKPLQTYLHDEMNMKLRAEISYGVTYEISTPAQGVDYVETESLEFATQIDSNRNLAGAAHAYGRRLSSETGAIRGNNYVNSQDRFMQIINSQFAAGVSYTVLHGYSSIEGADTNGTAWNGTYWPGHEGMTNVWSERWGPRQPESTLYTDYMPMIARTQAVLQQGKPQVDLAVMRTDYTFNPWLSHAPTYDDLRQRKAAYFKDLELQDNGYTYDYFAPEILETLSDNGIKSYSASGGLIPDNVGYQALILYQDSIRLQSAKAIYNLAKKGLPVVIVNGLIETTNPSQYRLHEEAAVHTLGNDGKDADLAKVMAELKKLKNVKEVNAVGLPDNATSPDPGDKNYEEKYYYGNSGVYEALQELGVQPRADYAEANKSILTTMRRTDDTVYLWAYNYMEKRGDYYNLPIDAKTTTETISVDAVGKPYSINTWTGDIAPLATYQQSGGRTSFDVTLHPGESTVIAIDLKNSTAAPVKSTSAARAIIGADGPQILATESGTYDATLADGSQLTKEVSVPDDVDLTDSQWNLVIDSWTAGDKVVVTEDRGNYVTKEVSYATKKTAIDVGATDLKAWKDMTFTDQAPETVAGVGTYSTTFTLPTTWGDSNGAYLKIGSTGGALAEVYVNGTRIKGYDFVSGQVDVSSALKPGTNALEIKVASPLRNQMLSLGYYATAGAGIAHTPGEYGLMGDIVLDTYTVSSLQLLVNTAPPTVSGVTEVGATLSAIAGTWSPEPTGFAYQWLRDGQAIEGATGSEFALTAADVDQKISVIVAATLDGSSVSAESAAAGPVVKSKLSNLVLPAIAGTAKVGSTLTVSDGTWSPAPSKLTYQWLRNGLVLGGATTNQYTLTPADLGAWISVHVTASAAGSESLSAITEPVGPVAKGSIVNTTRPVITGKAKVGSKLHASKGSWSPTPAKYAYQWYRNGKVIKKATSSSYKLTKADKGKKVSVKVTAKRTGYSAGSKTSKAVGPIKKK